MIKKLLDRRMVGFVLVELLMFHLADGFVDQAQKAGVVTMFFNISLGLFGVLVGGNVVQAMKGKDAAS